MNNQFSLLPEAYQVQIVRRSFVKKGRAHWLTVYFIRRSDYCSGEIHNKDYAYQECNRLNKKDMKIWEEVTQSGKPHTAHAN